MSNDSNIKQNAFINENKITAYASGKLDGLSFAVKDNIDIANEITGYGSPSWAKAHSKPVANAVCLEQLLAEGATCLGKTKSDELAYSLIGVNPFYGTPLNPKAPDRVPGGSSSGSASAVASKVVDFAIGTDTGGSIRVPASNCGIWGYRPSYGVVSVSGVLALAPSFDTVGVVAQTGSILEKVVQVLLADITSDNTSKTTICFFDDVFEMCNKHLLKAITPVIKTISKNHPTKHSTLAEATNLDINLVWLFEKVGLLMSAEIWNTFGAWVESGKSELSPGAAYVINNYAKSANRKDIQSVLYATKAFSKKLNKFLDDGNILCFPTTVDLAPRLDEVTPEFLATGDYIPRAMGVNAISGLSSTPQITIPVAETTNGVPIGLSFVAGCGRDMMLVNFCNQLQLG